MLKRQIGEEVKINPYSGITGIIIDNKEITKDQYYNTNWDYKVKLNKPCEGIGVGNNLDWQFFNDNELDILEKNYKLCTK